jgi:hypothetical protein
MSSLAATQSRFLLEFLARLIVDAAFVARSHRRIMRRSRCETICCSNPQPGLLIFTKGHYSVVIVIAEKPRATVAPAKDPQNLTDAEKIARYEQWRPFAASSGTYEINGSSLSIRPIVAKSANQMTRTTPISWELKLEGPNTLWLIPKDQSPTEPRVKLTRLE